MNLAEIDLRKVEVIGLAIEFGILVLILALGLDGLTEDIRRLRRAAADRRSSRRAARKLQREGDPGFWGRGSRRPQ
jgi:hypothetical protein